MLDVSHVYRTPAVRMHLVSIVHGFLSHWFLLELNQFNFAESIRDMWGEILDEGMH